MADTIDDGGPAHPVTDAHFDMIHGSTGMSKRELYAMAVMQGDWAAGKYCLLAGSNHSYDSAAKEYFKMADAMLRASKEVGGE